VLRVDIDHAPWPLQPAEAEVRRNTMTEPIGISLMGAPLLHFARRIDMVAWWPSAANSRAPNQACVRA
jgi:hypothetical protein